MKDRVLALAGLLQSLKIVRQIANNGEAESHPLEAVIESVFRIDADSTEAVYGGTANLWPGLRLLVEQIDGSGSRDPALTRMAATVLHLERRISRDRSLLEAIGRGIDDIARQRDHWGPRHPTVLARLGELYASTVSQVRPRVLVQGNPTYLGEPTVVAEIRAVLLASVRAAVLWRQVGGSYWDLFLRRRAMAETARSLLR